jgi:hypothetical protein
VTRTQGELGVFTSLLPQRLQLPTRVQSSYPAAPQHGNAKLRHPLSAPLVTALCASHGPLPLPRDHLVTLRGVSAADQHGVPVCQVRPHALQGVRLHAGRSCGVTCKGTLAESVREQVRGGWGAGQVEESPSSTGQQGCSTWAVHPVSHSARVAGAAHTRTQRRGRLLILPRTVVLVTGLPMV